MEFDDLMKRLQAEQLNLVKLGHQYDGLKKMFDAAALGSNGVECDDLRFKLHTILDAQLDSVALSMVLTRQILQSKGPEPK
jgi:hypothetical protein